MRWPWRRRHARHAAVPARRATWVAAALPPEVAQVVAEAVATPVAVPAQGSTHAVRLGFLDGSELALPAHDESARALRAVADLLVQDPQQRADT
jgi:hypothetical protein